MLRRLTDTAARASAHRTHRPAALANGIRLLAARPAIARTGASAGLDHARADADPPPTTCALSALSGWGRFVEQMRGETQEQASLAAAAPEGVT